MASLILQYDMFGSKGVELENVANMRIIHKWKKKVEGTWNTPPKWNKLVLISNFYANISFSNWALHQFQVNLSRLQLQGYARNLSV